MSASDRERQVAVIAEAMNDRPAGLIRHTQRVVAEAKALAERWDVDPQRLELAAWGHDLYRAHRPADLLAKAWEWKIPVSQAEEHSPMLLHGPVAACSLVVDYHIDDEEVIEAVREHTLGSPEMSLIAKILLLADKFEPNKRERIPLMREIRRMARHDIDLALLTWSDWRWVENRTNDLVSPPQFWEARQSWVPAHHEEFSRAEPARTEDGTWYDGEDALEPPPDRRTLEERRAARRAKSEALGLERDDSSSKTVR